MHRDLKLENFLCSKGLGKHAWPTPHFSLMLRSLGEQCVKFRFGCDITGRKLTEQSLVIARYESKDSSHLKLIDFGFSKVLLGCHIRETSLRSLAGC